jgi:hypothetical protein
VVGWYVRMWPDVLQAVAGLLAYSFDRWPMTALQPASTGCGRTVGQKQSFEPVRAMLARSGQWPGSPPQQNCSPSWRDSVADKRI